MDIQTRKSLTRNLSPIGAWAFALGTSIGWGSLVVTANTYLAQAGPVGSVIGLVLGAIIMLVVCQNFAYMMSCYPDAGGVYSFCRECFGYDHGFLAAWFLMLTYLAMLWANATSLPLFARYFLGDIFRFGRMYELFGYGVYLGEALLSVAFILAAAFLCARSKNVAARLMIGMVLLFVVGIVLCFCGAAIHLTDNWSPAFVTGKAPLGQIVKIAVISPWAFIGFESISHSTEEFSFPPKQILSGFGGIRSGCDFAVCLCDAALGYGLPPPSMAVASRFGGSPDRTYQPSNGSDPQRKRAEHFCLGTGFRPVSQRAAEQLPAHEPSGREQPDGASGCQRYGGQRRADRREEQACLY